MSCSSAPYSSHSRSRVAELVQVRGRVEEREREPRDLLGVRRRR